MQILSRTISHGLKLIRLLGRRASAYPLITIVVPLYNEARFIQPCLVSVQQQSYPQFECLIVNDASTDDSPRLAQPFIDQDNRFRLIPHAENQGLSATRNTGLRQAKGRYITFLDADDFLLPHSLWYRLLALHRWATVPEVAGSYCHILPVSEAGQTYLERLAYLKPVHGTPIDFITTQGECPFNVHAPLLKREILLKFKGFNENMRHGAEDWQLWSRILRHGYRFISADHIGAAYRQKKGSMVGRYARNHVSEGTDLIEWAHRPLAPAETVADTPYPFVHAWGYYQTAILKAKRLIRFATLAYLNQDRAATRHILSQLPTNSGYYLAHHVDIGGEIDHSIARYHGLSLKAYQSHRLSSHYQSIREPLIVLIKETCS